MRARIHHAWRVAGTGLSFLAFGLGGLFLGLCVLPPMLWLVRDPERRRRWARRIVQRSFAAHVELMRRLGVMTYELLTGRVPFVEPNMRTIQIVTRRGALDGPPPPVGSLRFDLSPAVDRALAWAMAPRREDRPQTATAFAEALGTALAG